MTSYQPSSTLTATTSMPFAGSGSTTAEAPGSGTDYPAWPWEVVLATVLSISIPDRSQVTSQPWLTITQNAPDNTSLHQIWAANRNTGPSSGPASIQIYLNPAVYTSGGAWDQLLNVPGPVMTDIAAGNYASLQVNPVTFQSASTSIAGVASMLGMVAQTFTTLSGNASADGSGFKGSMAQAVTELLTGLGQISQSLHGQMTDPASYSASAASSGDAAAAFLTSLESAYNGWTQVTEHSPLGAIVSVLTAIATDNGNGSYAIPDPQHTSYGDLTTPGAWAAVEQAAKNRWTSALTGNSDFAGLDPPAHSALSSLVTQYEATASALKPLIGPGKPPTPPSARNTVNSGNGGGSNGNGNGGGSGNAGGGRAGNAPAAFPAASTLLPGGGPGGGSSLGPAALLAGPAAMALSGPGGGSSGTALADQAEAGAAAAAPPPVAEVTIPGGLLAGPIGSEAQPSDPSADAAVPAGLAGLLSSSLGRDDSEEDGSEPGGAAAASGKRAGAPAAGFSIGQNAGDDGPVVPQAPVPALADSPRVASTAVNTQLVPSGTGLQQAAMAGGVPGADAGAAAAAGGPSDRYLMMLPPGMNSPGRQREQERQRVAYLPEDEEYWGTAPPGTAPAIGAVLAAEPAEYVPGPAIAGIGADRADRVDREASTDWAGRPGNR